MDTTMYAVVAVLTTAIISSTVAIKGCDNTIIEKLKSIGDCYNGGNPPANPMIADTYTIVRTTEGQSPPETTCSTIFAFHNLVQLSYFFEDNEHKSCVLTNIQKGDYFEEERSTAKCDFHPGGSKLRMYPIHHESNVYSFYRCADDGASGGEEGGHVGVVAVHHQNTDEAAANLVIQKAEKCFSALDITVKTIQPCQFQKQTQQ